MPKLSLFTPTNNPSFIHEAYHSLLQQDFRDWEWLIVANGDASVSSVSQALDVGAADWMTDERVRIVDGPNQSSGKIGELKRYACGQCKGDVFIELDHDDLLVPGILGKIAKAADDGAGFIYSDVAVFETEDEDLKTWGYSQDFGWEHYPLHVYGQKFTATRNFPLTPRMLCEVHYAPDHVRAWSRDAYYTAGGHDITMAVGDDHDLICRTYLASVPFHGLDCCGYLYRRHESNTVKLRNQAIQDQQAANRRKYLHPLIREWCRREGLETLELLELWRKAPNDWRPEAPVLSPDANPRLGFVYASDVLQFIPPELLTPFYNSVYKSLVPGGYFSVAVPAMDSQYAWQDWRMRNRFCRNHFLYLVRHDFNHGIPDLQCQFDMIELSDVWPSTDWKRFDMKMTRVDLAAIKGQRHPGYSPKYPWGHERFLPTK